MDVGGGEIRRQQRRIPGSAVEGAHAPVRLDDELGPLDPQVPVAAGVLRGWLREEQS